MPVLDITPTVRMRRRCVPAAMTGQMVAGLLGVVPLGLVIGLLNGGAALSGGLALVLAAAIAVVVALIMVSRSAERGSVAGAVLLAVVVTALLGYGVYALHQTLTYVAAMAPPRGVARTSGVSPTVLVFAAVAALATAVTLSGVFAALRYQRLLPPGLRAPAGRHAARALSGASFLHFVGAALCIGLPGVLGFTYVQWALNDSADRAPGWAAIGAFAVSGIACIEVGRRLFARGKRLRQVTAAELRTRDTRAPVLLLRSFADDLTPIARALDARSWRSGHAADLPLTLEETIERVLDAYGPVVAIGRPGEALPPAGAAREYVSNDAEWRPRIAALLAEAQRVTVVVGKTQGLAYEYESLTRAGAWPKTIILFPPLEQSELQARWELLVALAGRPSLARAVTSHPDALAAVFLPTGEPHFVTCRWRDDECYGLALRCLLSRAPFAGALSNA